MKYAVHHLLSIVLCTLIYNIQYITCQSTSTTQLQNSPAPYPIAPNSCNGDGTSADCTAFEPTPGVLTTNAPYTTLQPTSEPYAGVTTTTSATITPSATQCPATPGFYPDQNCLNSITGYNGQPQEGATSQNYVAHDTTTTYCSECQQQFSSVGSNSGIAGGASGSSSSGSTYVVGSGTSSYVSTSSSPSSTTNNGGAPASSASGSASNTNVATTTSPTQAIVTSNGQLTTPNNGSTAFYPYHNDATGVNSIKLICVVGAIIASIVVLL